MRYTKIKERGLEKKIKDAFYKDKLSKTQIAKKYDLNYVEVYYYLREDKIRNYDDENLEAISMSDEVSPLSAITHYFQSVHQASKELAFTGILAQMYREEIAKIVDEEGLSALSLGSNNEIMRLWHKNAQKLNKLVELAPKQLEGYINLFAQVLDVQREVSYVKIVTDLLRKDDPVLYHKLQRALNADPVAKKVLDSLTREDIITYWDSEVGSVVREKVPVLEE